MAVVYVKRTVKKKENREFNQKKNCVCWIPKM